jgi:hypothetical protein
MFACKQLALSAKSARVPALAVVVWGLLSLSIPLHGQRLAGYAWPEDHSEHIMYIGVDSHVHELWLAIGGSWQHDDLIANSCANPKPPAAASNMGPVAAFVWRPDNTEHVIYIGNDFHVHELWLKRAAAGGDGCWHHTDLNRLPPAIGFPLPDASSGLAAFEWPDDLSEHFFFKGQDGSIYEISKRLIHGRRNDGWSLSDYSAGPAALGPVTGYIGQTGDSKHLVYLDQNGGLVDWSVQLSSGRAFLDTPPDGGAAGTALAAFAWPEDNSRHIFTANLFGFGGGTVIETYSVGSNPWSEYGILETLDPPNPPQVQSLAGYVFPVDNSEHVIYIDNVGRIGELVRFHYGTKWLYNDLTVNSVGFKSLVDPSSGLAGFVWTEDQTEHVISIGCGGFVNELWLKAGSNWNNDSPSLETNAPLAATSGCDNYPPL